MKRIRPKSGDRVVFSSWESRTGDPPAPPHPWAGTVLGSGLVGKMTMYQVKRDHDRRVIQLTGDMMRYEVE